MKTKDKKSPAKKAVNILVYILSAIIGGAVGFLIADRGFSSDEGPLVYLFEVAVAFLLSVYIGLITHEAGHLLFGFLSGYGFSSFRIGSIMLVKRQGKLSLCRYSLAGTAGQCLMIPPKSENGEIPVVLYNLGGVIVNLAVGALSLLLCFFADDIFLLTKTLFLTAFVSFFLAISNGLPMNVSGLANDGMNAKSLRKSPLSAEAFRLQLVINGEVTDGKRSRDIPDEYFELLGKTEIDNVHIASLAVFRCGKIMDEHKFDEALEAMNTLLNSESEINGVHRMLLVNDCIYIHLLKRNTEEVRVLLTNEQKKFMKLMEKFPSIIRTEYAIALVMEENKEKAEKAEQSFRKVKKHYPHTADILAEEEFISLVKNEKREGNFV